MYNKYFQGGRSEYFTDAELLAGLLSQMEVRANCRHYAFDLQCFLCHPSCVDEPSTIPMKDEEDHLLQEKEAALDAVLNDGTMQLICSIVDVFA